MKAYIKGAIASLVVISAALVWYVLNRSSLPVEATPTQFKLIDRMEKDGVPSFTLPRLDGSTFDFQDVQGKVVILNFWASWCNPCVQEFPSLIKLVERFGGEVRLVAVSTDEAKEDVEAFLKAFGLPKPNIEIVLDKDRKIASEFGVGKIPESFLVGRDGRLIRKVVGIEDWYTDGSIAYFSRLVGNAETSAPPHASFPAPSDTAGATEATERGAPSATFTSPSVSKKAGTPNK